MTFSKTACLAAMLMCCSQTAFALNMWDEHLNAQTSADKKTVTSSGFSETFKAGGTQKAEQYTIIYIGHVDVKDSETSSVVVNNNKGVMGSGLKAEYVNGGFASAGCNFEVKGNEIVLENGSKAAFSYGGYAIDGFYENGQNVEGVVSGNLVTAEKGATAGVVMGGLAELYPADAVLSVVDNTVTATGATVYAVWGGYADSLKSYASKNTVILSDAVAEEGYTGGYRGSIVGGICDAVRRSLDSSASSFNAEHIASDNTVIINKSKIGIQVCGSGVIGASSNSSVAKDTVQASGNTVMLTDTEFSGSFICGANVYMPTASESTSISVTANDNKVVLYGGNYSLKDDSAAHPGALSGGIAIYGGYISGETGNYSCIEASNNRIELRNGSNGTAPVFSDSTYIFGGYAYYTMQINLSDFVTKNQTVKKPRFQGVEPSQGLKQPLPLFL